MLAEEEGRGSVEQEASEEEVAAAGEEEEEEAAAAAAGEGSAVESWTRTTPIVRSITWCSGSSGCRGRSGRR